MAKIIAFYLPQYHSIPENDEWWGEGFTEWTNVKKAKPIFKNHCQPKEPYNDYYYNLLDNESRKWQSNLAQKYGIYGFCYYHYWFNGKLLLQKPLEKVLELNEPDLPYCMCWANEPWTRAWDDGEKIINMPQSYGNKEEWQKHINYLLPYFKDNRYIKVNNKPLFVIYRTSNIKNCDEMISYWNQCCIEDGFNGIYTVEELNSFQNKPYSNLTEAVIEFEPMYTITSRDVSFYIRQISKIKSILRKRISNNKLAQFYNYDYIWNKIIKRKHNCIDKQVFLGAFVDWDNSARKKNKGTIFKGATPKKFQLYLKKQLDKSKELNSEFLFINAWNEWGEGTYLEPDKKNEFQYLEAVKAALEESGYKVPINK